MIGAYWYELGPDTVETLLTIGTGIACLRHNKLKPSQKAKAKASAPNYLPQ